ncbi:2-aminoethylphosphonate--pyruvate transaminase [Hypericibacter terrae]|uniref:2-aminoethylphosphonate--pyruvate transaminase n=1 Tax=Hypericibacter terrae TaxID=2602015 RepID=A0A5J6MKL4_9PROT|nr:2-aminoethylphosphonate--pyruvate transaminase [Hypericibacter terrae]QEX17914.1 2-aminoethylphosphonate--pyruvate transaminase [Hypericibacter terrae]
MPRQDPWLLTPGPLTTSLTVKQAMLHDWGSRDQEFIEINAGMRRRLVEMIQGGDRFTTVPMQGSGTFAVEAMLGTFLPRDGKALILINGAYGKRMTRICAYAGRPYSTVEAAEDKPIDPAAVAKALASDPAITHVCAVHCETTSGVLNPIAEIGAVVAKAGRRLLIDAMSAFGAIPLLSTEVAFDAVAASSNKCIEGVPGLGFVIARIEALKATKGNAHALTLDLHDQWEVIEKTQQYRFTPPIHCIVAFAQALDEHAAEGGVEGRGARYRNNCRILVDGMRAMGFETLLPDRLQAPIIVTFHMPADPRFVFESFYDRLRERGYVIYPGKLTVADSFRIGCIGRLGEAQMRGALEAVRAVMNELGVKSGAPAKLAASA